MECLYTDNDIFEAIKNMIKPDYLGNSKLYLKENKSNYNSIYVSCEKSAYRLNATGDMLLATVKTTAKTKYVGFSNNYRRLLKKLNIPFKEIKSSQFLRLDLSCFSLLSGITESLTELVNEVFISVFCFEPFGCCSRYVACSDARKCLHEDSAYATACMYRKNLDSGKIFYGKNKNI